MKIKAILLGLVIILLLSQGLSLNAQIPHLNIISGNKYLELTENERVLYIYGLYDMWLYMYAINFPDTYKTNEEVIEIMPPSQIRKIFEKHLEENPEELHYSAPSLFCFVMDKLIGDNNGK